MIDLFGDVLRVLAGVGFGVLGLFFAVTTWRTFRTGSEAYEANRSASASSIGETLKGCVPVTPDREKRYSHGLAIDLVSKKIFPQQRLSRESVDDVIGRRI